VKLKRGTVLILDSLRLSRRPLRLCGEERPATKVICQARPTLSPLLRQEVPAIYPIKQVCLSPGYNSCADRGLVSKLEKVIG
jgi:hypothetical protein